MENVNENFWPTSLGGKALETKLKKTSIVLYINMVLLFCGGFGFAFGYLSENLITGKREFTIMGWYPFDWTVAPVYQTIYVIQWIGSFYYIFFAILGHDCLFMSLFFNCYAQFKILKQFLRKFGVSGSDDKEILRKCINHHNILLK